MAKKRVLKNPLKNVKSKPKNLRNVKSSNSKQKNLRNIKSSNSETVKSRANYSSYTGYKKPTTANKRKQKKKDKSLVKKILLGLSIFFAGMIVLMIIFLIFIALTAPSFDENKLYTKNASTLYDSDGKAFATLGSENRVKIKYKDLSESLVNAIVATEDSRFFQHNGVDFPRFFKASVGQALGQNAGGASTLTMQVSKNQFTSTESSGLAGIKRKFTDIYISMFNIEKDYSKEEILEFYVNSYYLGSGSYGVEQAARTYFGKNAKDLNISESALIAGLFQSPGYYDPNINPDAAEARRIIALKLMKRHGYITKDEYEIAKKLTVDKIIIKRKEKSSYAEYQGFIDTVAVEVKDKTGYDPYSTSMKIYTTMKRSKQDYVAKIMNGDNYTWENKKVDAGVVAIDNETGEIVAVGSGRNSDGAKSFNNATMIKRQIGSTAKPLYDYGPAIEYNGWNPSHLIIDNPTTYSDGTKINNWDGAYKGVITIRQALVESRNIPALKTFKSVENSKIKEFVTNLGLSPEVGDGDFLHEAHSIGGYNGESPMTLAAAYSAFANKGKYIEPHSFTKIEFDETGKTYKNDIKTNDVMSEETAYMVTDMLVDTGQNALGSYNHINGGKFAAKTGTTNFDEVTMNKYNLPSGAVNDLWVAGFDSKYAIAVWYGYDSLSSKHYNYFGSSQNSKLFNKVAKKFFSSTSKFEKPSGIKSVTIEKTCGNPMLPSANTPSSMKTKEIFSTKSVPKQVSERYNQLTNVSNLTSSVNGNQVKLSWKTISTPSALNNAYWSPIVNKAFSIKADQNQYLSYIMSFNKGLFGKVVYKIYEDGKLVSTTSNATVTVTPSQSNPTYVVKTSYSKYGGCDSKGTSTSVTYTKTTTASDLDFNYIGDNPITVSTGSYTDPDFTVKKSGQIITGCTLNRSKVINNSTKASAKDVFANTPGNYTITYNATCSGVTTSEKTRVVIVK